MPQGTGAQTARGQAKLRNAAATGHKSGNDVDEGPERSGAEYKRGSRCQVSDTLLRMLCTAALHAGNQKFDNSPSFDLARTALRPVSARQLRVLPCQPSPFPGFSLQQRRDGAPTFCWTEPRAGAGSRDGGHGRGARREAKRGACSVEVHTKFVQQWVEPWPWRLPCQCCHRRRCHHFKSRLCPLLQPAAQASRIRPLLNATPAG